MRRSDFLRIVLGGVVFLWGGEGLKGLLQAGELPKYNVLFIAVDDLRPELGCYGHPVVKSPQIDRLAKSGLRFNRAYCQQAVCSPSRTSLLTGLRPDTTKVYDLQTHFRKTIPNVVTLPELFKRHGYHTVGLGKIFHGGLDDAQSWSEPAEVARRKIQATVVEQAAPANPAGASPLPANSQKKYIDPWLASDYPDEKLRDGMMAEQAVDALRRLRDKPFFLATGFLKPHLPFVSPKKYWDLYAPETIRPAKNPFPPRGAPDYALSSWGELRSYRGMPDKGPLSPEQARQAVHGYYAAVSYTDALIGKLLDELERLKLRDKTIVILWGDHGWHLGEHGLWCKHTNYEVATRAPLIISVPGQTTAGEASNALVEFVDIYPTLCELCGIAAPAALEGTPFTPLLKNPARPWKKAAFSQYPRNISRQGAGMGYAMRTERYRFVEWRVPGKDFREYELYDHQADPGEDVNLARRPESAALVRKLAEELHAGWQWAKANL